MEVYATAQLIGFWQFADSGGRYFGVLERGADGGGSTLAIGRLSGGGAEVVKRVNDTDTSIRALDARVIGQNVVFVTELNRGTPLQLVRASIASLVDPAVAQVPFTDLVDLGLSARQIERVQLPPTLRWHVADVLPPAGWLFSPRLVRGATREPEVVVNTADGRTVFIGPGAADAGVELPDAAQPGAYQQDGRRHIAFLRHDERYYPFWSLARYSGDARPASGDLFAAAGEATENLSVDLGIGPVLAFALAGDARGATWIFALRGGPDVAELIALVRQDAGWTVAQISPLDGAAERIVVEHGADAWHVLYAVRDGGWSLRYLTWSGR